MDGLEIVCEGRQRTSGIAIMLAAVTEQVYGRQ